MKNKLAGIRPTIMQINKSANLNPWYEYEEKTTLDETLQIIDDALCHGFEFKVENGKLYYREIPLETKPKEKKREPFLYYFTWTLMILGVISMYGILFTAIALWLS